MVQSADCCSTSLTGQTWVSDFVCLTLDIPFTDGIEHCWGFCKRLYKQKIEQLRVNQDNVDNLEVVNECIAELDDQRCSRIAAAGWRRLEAAVPVQPERPANVPEVSSDEDDSQIQEANFETSSEEMDEEGEVEYDSIDWEEIKQEEFRLVLR